MGKRIVYVAIMGEATNEPDAVGHMIANALLGLSLDPALKSR